MAQPTQIPLPGGAPGGDDMIAGGPPGGFPGGPGPRGGLLLPPGMMLVLLGLGAVVTGVAFWQIYRKAGLSGALGLLMIIPGVNLVMMLWFAFTEWPVLKELREQRAVSAMWAEQHAAEQHAAPAAASAADPEPQM